jgi:putative ATP-dependent endonuclease of OLD family
MKLERFKIQTFRSIENITINFPVNKPVVIFGPNNVGKSNILRSLDSLLGERYAPYLDFQDSDFFSRDREDFPNIHFSATFDEVFHSNRGESTKTICFTTNYEGESITESTYHFENGKKMYLKNEERDRCNFILIDAARDINRQLSYFSQYSILSKMAKRMHGVLVGKTKTQLDKHFVDIKNTFESVPEYKKFHERLQSSFENNVSGFEHKLEIDLSAYDPNNYFNSLRIIAKDGSDTRSFDEFGTGEQQILLMSFVKAYAETFKGQNFILGIEEPEAHLHPLAQRWLAKNMSDIAKSGIQIILTTHSPEFLNIENLDGFVKIYKENGITKAIQHTALSLTENCLKMKANSQKTTVDTILPFYKINTFYDQLKGFFARKLILVEGPTEVYSLPNYFSNLDFDLIKNGVEIIDCRGKSQIARNYRLFTSYGYACFCLFDADSANNEESARGNDELHDIFGFVVNDMNKNTETFTCDIDSGYGYFGKDFESYMHSNITDYSKYENNIQGGKILKAKIISEKYTNIKPGFITEIAKSLKLT